MRLIELSSDNPKFRTVKFNPCGLTIILGKKLQSASSSQGDEDSNGVGKTLLLRLVNFCLGGENLSIAIPQYEASNFSLKFKLGDNEHIIKRSYDGKEIYLDDQKKSINQLRKWLDEYGPFDQLSFRSLFRWFARVNNEYCVEPLSFAHGEPEYNVLLQVGYLLGLDIEYITRKKELRDKEQTLSKAINFYKNSDVLKQIYDVGDNPQTRLKRLEDTDIPAIESALEKCQIADNYREIEQEADQFKIQLEEQKKQKAVIDFQLRNIEKTLTYKIDVTKDELMELYTSLQDVFKPEALQTFVNIESFHHSLHAKRTERLLHDQLELTRQRENIENQVKNLSQKMDQKLAYLKGKKALDEVVALHQRLSSLQEEQKKIQEYFDFEKEKKQERNQVKQQLLAEDVRSEKYLECNPLQEIDKNFSNYVKQIYSKATSGIAITNNDGDKNQKRFNLDISLSQDDAEGIAASKLRCFDLVLFLHGHCRETMNMLWHDNRLFADTSEQIRAKWFQLIIKTLKDYPDKQYVASINEENYNSMMQYLTSEEQKIIKDATVIKLSGDQDTNKLLGVTCG